MMPHTFRRSPNCFDSSFNGEKRQPTNNCKNSLYIVLPSLYYYISYTFLFFFVIYFCFVSFYFVSILLVIFCRPLLVFTLVELNAVAVVIYKLFVGLKPRREAASYPTEHRFCSYFKFGTSFYSDRCYL